MKKAFKLMATLICVTTLFTLAGCEKIADKVAPKDTWCEAETNYTSGESKIEVYTYFYYSDTGFTSPKLADNVNIGPGLTVVIRPKTASQSSALFGNEFTDAYAIKTFPKASKVEMGESEDDDDENDASFEVSDAKWAAIYLGALKTADGMPACLDKSIGAKPITDLAKIKEKFSIKKILKNILWKYLD